MTTTPKRPAHPAGGDFVPTDELIRQQGVQPIASPNDSSRDDPYASDDEHADFLADLSAFRRSSTS